MTEIKISSNTTQMNTKKVIKKKKKCAIETQTNGIADGLAGGSIQSVTRSAPSISCPLFSKLAETTQKYDFFKWIENIILDRAQKRHWK